MKKSEVKKLSKGKREKQCFLKKEILGIFIFSFLMQFSVNASNSYSQSTKINLHVRNADLEQVIWMIKKQTEFNFFYNSEDVKSIKGLNVNLKNASTEEVLKYCLNGTNLTYQIVHKAIILKKADRPIRIIQKKTVPPKNNALKGKVTNHEGNPMPGVSILIKGTNIGAVTDINGEYILSNVSNNATIIFSFIGMKPTTINLNGQSELNVIMDEDVRGLNEVVVVAYGTQKKETITGSISSISTKEIKQSPASNLAVTLAGRLPGLTAIQTSGEPGRDYTNLYLRGQGTTNGQNPIILVDGVERELSYIDPNEVENITILKDASSTALFGVRGANGVILVTTKRGGNATPQINLSVETGIQDFTRKPHTINSYDYASLINQARENDGNPDKYSSFALAKYKAICEGDLTNADPTNYANNNWIKYFLKDYSAETRYNLNVSGGKNVRYYVNAGYLHQGGQFKTSNNNGAYNYDHESWLDRYNFRTNIDADLNKTLILTMNAAGYFEKVNSPNRDIPTILSRIYGFPPTLPGPTTPDGQVLTTTDFEHPPFGMLNGEGYRRETLTNITSSFQLEQKLGMITPGLSTKFMFSFDCSNDYNLTAGRDYQRWIQIIDPETNKVTYQQWNDGHQNSPLSLGTSTSFTSYMNFQYYLNYDRTFGKHHITGLGLYQQDQKVVPGDRIPYNRRGFSSRITYGYDNKYFAEFNAGYNASEQFAPGKRWGFFPSISGGWVISNESFLKNSEILTMLKLRGSYGKVGNDQLNGSRFLYLDNITKDGGGINGSLGQGSKIDQALVGNPSLTWETSKKLNIGLDMGITNDFSITTDVFRERRNNILITRNSVPMVIGMFSSSLPAVNMGVINNHGYEIEATYKKAISHDLSFLTRANISYAKNKIIKFDEVARTGGYIYPYQNEGYAIGQCWGYIIDKNHPYFSNQTEINNYARYNIGSQPRPGDFRYKDLNGDGVIDSKDEAPIGYSPVPRYTYGWASSITYKNVDFSFLFQGTGECSDYYSGWGVFETQTLFRIHDYAWTAERAAKGEEIDYPALSQNQSSSQQPNSYFIYDKSFIRLKNLEIGYTFPINISQKISAQKIRIYANGQNLITWDHMPKYTHDFDPESSNSLTYPIYRVFNFGINVIF